MSWNDLQDWIAQLTPEQRRTNLTVYVGSEDEFCSVRELAINNGPDLTDVLDEGHPYLVTPA